MLKLTLMCEGRDPGSSPFRFLLPLPPAGMPGGEGRVRGDMIPHPLPYQPVPPSQKTVREIRPLDFLTPIHLHFPIQAGPTRGL